MLFAQVVRAVDDAEIFPAAALEGGLRELALAAGDEAPGFDDHALAARFGQLEPPVCDRLQVLLRVGAE
jgi:hypothetical protein